MVDGIRDEEVVAAARRRLRWRLLTRSWLAVLGLIVMLVGAVQTVAGELGFLVMFVLGDVLTWSASQRPVELFRDLAARPVEITGELRRKWVKHHFLFIPQYFGSIESDDTAGLTEGQRLRDAPRHLLVNLPMMPMLGTFDPTARPDRNLSASSYSLSSITYNALTEGDVIRIRVFPHSQTVIDVRRYGTLRDRFDPLSRG